MRDLWLESYYLFDPIQYVFNGNFWEMFRKKFSKFSKGKVVDLACGTGELRKWVNPEKYLGVDLNSSYIGYAAKRFPGENTKFVVGDIAKVNLGQKYETAFFVSAVHHLTDKQLTATFKNLQKNKVKNLIVVDGYPHGPLAGLLAWLDAYLAGGKYFRKEDQIVELVKPYYKVAESGVFWAKNSFYFYPYVVASFGQRRPTPSQKVKRRS